MSEPVTLSLERTDENAERPAVNPYDGPLFVVGMFRSGTSLLYALLNQHPQIALMYESDLACLAPLFWFGRNTSQWLQKWDSWNGAITKHKADFSALMGENFNHKSAVRAVYVEYARQKKGASVWGCKSPTYCNAITRLGHLFPNARFLIIWRDLRAICRSLLAAAEASPFFSRRGMVLRVILGYHEMYLQCEALAKAGGQIHQLNYEDLVRDPATHMRAICDFLQIPFDPRMTQLTGADRSAIDDFGHHSLVKSEHIVAEREKPMSLPPSLARKIDRYVHLWRQQSGGAWPAYPRSLAGNIENPSLWERFRDRVAYRALCLWRDAAPVVFSMVPTKVWTGYRRFIDARRRRRLGQKLEPS